MKMKVRDLKRKATPLASPVKYSAVGEGGGSVRVVVREEKKK